MNSEPKLDVSQLPWFLENQYIGALFRKMRKPVRDRRVIMSPAWSESTNYLTVKAMPLGSGALLGIIPYNIHKEWLTSLHGLY